VQARQLIKFLRQFVDANETGIDQCTDSRSADANTVEIWPTIHVHIPSPGNGDAVSGAQTRQCGPIHRAPTRLADRDHGPAEGRYDRPPNASAGQSLVRVGREPPVVDHALRPAVEPPDQGVEVIAEGVDDDLLRIVGGSLQGLTQLL
jgi:hypothetical protein